MKRSFQTLHNNFLQTFYRNVSFAVFYMVHECPVDIGIPCNGFLREIFSNTDFSDPVADFCLNFHLGKVP